MESIKIAADATASYLNSDNKQNKDTNSIAGGKAPQDSATGTSQSGVEPVSGKLGEGEAGEPYDAGNEDKKSS